MPIEVGDLVKCKGDSPFLPGVGIVIETRVRHPELYPNATIERAKVFWFDEHYAWDVSSRELEVLSEK